MSAAVGTDPQSALSSIRTLKADRDKSASLDFQISKFGYAPKTWFLDPGALAVRLFREGERADQAGRHRLAQVCVQICSLLTGCDAEPDARVAPGLFLPNPFGVCIWCHAGEDLTIMAHSGTGAAFTGRLGVRVMPQLGSDVLLAPYTGVQGPLEIGDRVTLHAGTAVRTSLPSDTTWVQHTPPLHCAEQPSSGSPSLQDHSRRRYHFKEMFADYKEDIKRTLSIRSGGKSFDDVRASKIAIARTALSNSLLTLLLYRLAHYFHCCGLRPLAVVLSFLSRLVFKSSIAYDARLAGGVFLPHPAGTTITGQAGRNLTLYAQSSILSDGPGVRSTPILGNNVTITAHSTVMGAVRVGNGAWIAPKATVYNDVPDGAHVFRRGKMGKAESALTENSQNRETPSELSMPDRADLKRADRTRSKELKAKGTHVPVVAQCAVSLHRRAHAAHRARRLRLARALWLLNRYMTGADISPRSVIGPGFVLISSAGVVIDARIGKNATFYGMNVVGGRLDGRRQLLPLHSQPHLGDDIVMEHKASVLGAHFIGSGSKVAPGVVVNSDVASNVWVRPPGTKTTFWKHRDGAQ